MWFLTVSTLFCPFLLVTQHATSHGLAPHPGWLEPPTSQQANDNVHAWEMPFLSHFEGYPNIVTNTRPAKLNFMTSCHLITTVLYNKRANYLNYLLKMYYLIIHCGKVKRL